MLRGQKVGTESDYDETRSRHLCHTIVMPKKKIAASDAAVEHRHIFSLCALSSESLLVKLGAWQILSLGVHTLGQLQLGMVVVAGKLPLASCLQGSVATSFGQRECSERCEEAPRRLMPEGIKSESCEVVFFIFPNP